MRWRVRRRALLLLLLVVIAGVAIAIHHYSQPQRLSALLVGQLQARYGLDLRLPQPASVEFLPTLQLRMDQPLLAGAGNAAPIIVAERIELRVPWSTLFGSQPVIERIELVQPRIDLDAFQLWLATKASSKGPTSVPAFSLSTHDATVLRGGQPIATSLNVELDHAGELGAWIDQWSNEGAAASPIPPVSGSVDAASIRIGETRLDGIKLRIDESAPVPTPKP